MTVTGQSRERPASPAVIVAVLVAFAAIGTATLASGAFVLPLRDGVMTVADALLFRFDVAVPHRDLERILNTVIFMPLGTGLVLLLGLRWWPIGLLAGPLLSVAIEFAQSTVPGRVPDAEDIVLNSLGATAGALLAFIVLAATTRLARRRHETRYPRPTPGRHHGARARRPL